MPPPLRQAQILALRSGNRCAFPNCGQSLVAERTELSVWEIVGEMAHIRARRPGGARYDPSMTAAERDAADNLIYLCPTHHKVIDKQPADWPVERLLAIKRDHERAIGEATVRIHAAAIANVGFAELEAVTGRLLSTPVPSVPDFTLTMPEQKLLKNGLSERTRALVLIGTARMREVEGFVQSEAQLDAEFPQRLVAGFLGEYHRLVQLGVSGDDRFDGLRIFAAGGSDDALRQAAALSVLVYLFEKCELFEP